jgi:ABC-type transporter Mla maintaining outer membrane lipid asymmetry permease subunit MlaE
LSLILVGLPMLREFAPLITAIHVVGRSGAAYTAQIGTMLVTEEIDALRTIGIAPQGLSVLPKLPVHSMSLVSTQVMLGSSCARIRAPSHRSSFGRWQQ